MNFLEKTKAESSKGRLSFLKEHGFMPNEGCGYGCCKGYYRGFHSSSKLDYNRVTVFIKDNVIKVVNHNEYDVGGHNYNMRYHADLETATDADILKIIEYVLPKNLD